MTGAASGIGAALVDKDATGLGATASAVAASRIVASPHVVDLADPAAILALLAAVLDHHGRLDLLVNKAGWRRADASRAPRSPTSIGSLPSTCGRWCG